MSNKARSFGSVLRSGSSCNRLSSGARPTAGGLSHAGPGDNNSLVGSSKRVTELESAVGGTEHFGPFGESARVRHRGVLAAELFKPVPRRLRSRLNALPDRSEPGGRKGERLSPPAFGDHLVAVAECDGRHLHQNFAPLRLGNRNLPEFQLIAADVVHFPEVHGLDHQSSLSWLPVRRLTAVPDPGDRVGCQGARHEPGCPPGQGRSQYGIVWSDTWCADVVVCLLGARSTDDRRGQLGPAPHAGRCHDRQGDTGIPRDRSEPIGGCQPAWCRTLPFRFRPTLLVDPATAASAVRMPGARISSTPTEPVIAAGRSTRCPDRRRARLEAVGPGA